MTKRKSALSWRLHEVMVAAGIRFGSELTRELQGRGHAISVQQINRLIKSPPARLDMRLLVSLTDVLNCQIGDLIQISSARGQRGRPIVEGPTAPTPDSGSSPTPKASLLNPLAGEKLPGIPDILRSKKP